MCTLGLVLAGYEMLWGYSGVLEALVLAVYDALSRHSSTGRVLAVHPGGNGSILAVLTVVQVGESGEGSYAGAL